MTQFNANTTNVKKVRIHAPNNNIVEIAEKSKWFHTNFTSVNIPNPVIGVKIPQTLIATEKGHDFVESMITVIEIVNGGEISEMFENDESLELYVVGSKISHVAMWVESFCKTWNEFNN